MRLGLKIIKNGLIVIGGLILLLALSVPFDALIGQGRVGEMTNEQIILEDGVLLDFYVAGPDEPGVYPVVIMIHEFFGLRADIIEKADALAAEGYIVVAPDTYGGQSTGWLPRAIYLVMQVDYEQVNRRMDGLYQWLGEQDGVNMEQVGIVGFCYGGRVSMAYSVHRGDLQATAVLYGGQETGVADLRRVGGPVLGIFGGVDSSIPVEEVNRFKGNLAEAGIPHEVTIYDGVGHAFVSDMETINSGGAAGEAWGELLGFFERELKGSGR